MAKRKPDEQTVWRAHIRKLPFGLFEDERLCIMSCERLDAETLPVGWVSLYALPDAVYRFLSVEALGSAVVKDERGAGKPGRYSVALVKGRAETIASVVSGGMGNPAFTSHVVDHCGDDFAHILFWVKERPLRCPVPARTYCLGVKNHPDYDPNYDPTIP